jgi:hypothetical protein
MNQVFYAIFQLFPCYIPLIKVKLSRNKSWRLREGMECWAYILTLPFGTTRTAELSALHTGRASPPRKFLGTRFCYRLSGPQGYWMRTEGIGQLKISKNPTRNRTQSLPSCGAVSQPTVAPLAPIFH